MVVTIALETHEARVAADEAMEHTGRLLLVPRIDDRFATVGTVAKIEVAGGLPGGGGAPAVGGAARAHLGPAAPGPSAPCSAAEPVAEAESPSDEVRQLASEYRAVIEQI